MDRLSLLYGTGHRKAQYCPRLAAHGSFLKEIKEVLEYNDLEKIVDFLKAGGKKGLTKR